MPCALANHGFVTLDLPSEAAQAERDPASFLGRHPPPVIIDEVQYAAAAAPLARRRADGDRGDLAVSAAQR
jgi:hypothetical protein